MSTRIPILAVTFAATCLPVCAQQLNYGQKRLLKDADYHAKNAANIVRQMQVLAKRAQTKNEVRQGQFQVNQAKNKIRNAQTRLSRLPQGNADVRRLTAQITAMRKAIVASEAAFRSATKSLAIAADPASWPQLESDREKLQGLQKEWQNLEFFMSHTERAVQALPTLPRARALIADLEKRYAPLFAQHTPHGGRLRHDLDNFKRQIARVDRKIPDFRRTAPEQCNAELEQATKWAGKAVANKNPGFFRGVVRQNIERCRTRVTLLAAMPGTDNKLLTDLRSRVDKVETDTGRLEASLRDVVIATNKVPSTRYRGADQKTLIELARKKWSAKYPNDEILAVRIPMSQWRRKSGYKWHSMTKELSKYDYSILQAAVLIKHDDKIATNQLVTFYKKHLQGDRINTVVESKGKTPSVRRMLPITKIK